MPETYAWSPIQTKAIDAVGRWLQSDTQVFRLYGYAGTGKTTLAKYLAELQNGLTLFCAYTGKAASVLQQRGCPNASTIHSILYTVGDDHRLEYAFASLAIAEREQDHARIDELTHEIEELQAEEYKPSFYLNPASIIANASLVVLDECSMVDERVGQDLLSFGTKVLVLGDPAQLPPIMGAGYFTEAKPNVMLSEIHRQAADNPIIQYATLARQGKRIPMGDCGLARRIEAAELDTPYYATEAGQILCGLNRTRQSLNRRVRKHLGRLHRYPVRGDTLIMLRNDRRQGVLNGVVCAAHSAALDGESPHHIVLNVDYEGRTLYDLPVSRGHFDNTYEETQVSVPYSYAFFPMDYGYALTVHKAQGSQWDKVTVVDDGWGRGKDDQRRQWLYTAITRAQRELTIAV